MIYYALVTLYVLVCLLLIVVILLQQGKGGDIANAFGGGGSQAAFGARAGATLLTKMTTVLAGALEPSSAAPKGRRRQRRQRCQRIRRRSKRGRRTSFSRNPIPRLPAEVAELADAPA
jgi:protein translocase SecG subunit